MIVYPTHAYVKLELTKHLIHKPMAYIKIPTIKDTLSPYFSINQTDGGFIGKYMIINIQLK